MPLLIGGKRYNPQNLTGMIDAVKKLPQPEIVPLELGAHLPSEEVLLCLQREVIYVDELNPNNSIKYMGSKMVVQCIAVYIHSPTDHLVVHVDQTTSLEFTPYIKQFNSKTNLKVTLAGGAPGGAPGKASQENLERILQALCQTSKDLEIEILIEYQKINENNRFTQEDEYDYAFDRYIEKIDLVSRQLFGQKLVDQELDVKYFAYNALRAFKKTIFDILKSDNKKDLDKGSLPLTTISDWKKNIYELLQITEVMFALVAETYDVNKSGEMIKNEVEAVKNETFPNLQAFLNTAKYLFSKEGFDLHSKRCKENNSFPSVALSSFVFALDSNKIYKISVHMQTIAETHRIMRIFDYYKLAPGQQDRYRLFYNGRFNHLYLPPLSLKTIEECESVKPKVEKNIIDSKFFSDKLHIPERPYQKIVAKFIRYTLGSSELHSLYLKRGFVLSGPKRSPKYLDEDVKSPNDCLNHLNYLFGREFILKRREYRHLVLDAIYAGELSKKEADELEAELIRTGITYIIENNFEGKDGWYRFIVPAINIEHYAKAIEAAAQLKNLNATPATVGPKP